LEGKPVDVIVGARLATIRAARDIGPGQLASVLGITEKQVGRYEAGTERIPSDQVLEICQLLRIKIADLFPVAGQEPAPQRSKPH
jgi:DNA-binding Xre family transcriptional regulator